MAAAADGKEVDAAAASSGAASSGRAAGEQEGEAEEAAEAKAGRSPSAPTQAEREAHGLILGLSSVGHKSQACLMDSMG